MSRHRFVLHLVTHCLFTQLVFLPKGNPDQRLGHSLGRCSRLLQSLECNSFDCKRGKRSPLNTTSGSNNSEKHAGDSQPARDPVGQGNYFILNADCAGRSDGTLGHKSRTNRDVSRDKVHVNPCNNFYPSYSKDVRLPVQLQRAMAAEAEAAREARAKVIAAEGEQKASRALKEAAEVITQSPAALQLRYLQTLNTISAEKNSTIIFPLPIDFIGQFVK